MNPCPPFDPWALVAHHGSPLLVLDCDAVRAQYWALAAALPGVALHYAIKALPQPEVIATLDELGGGFDIATGGEIELLRARRVDPRRCIHTHPIKRDRDIREALRFGCTTFVVDNADELAKFARYRSRVGLLLRVSFRSRAAAVDLSKKFGCPLEEAPLLLARARQLGLHVKGLSFHVGSQCADPAVHAQAIRACAGLMRDSRTAGAPLSVLDIGGGFPVAYEAPMPDIETYCAPLREALAELPDSVRVLAEPGRFLVAPAMTALASVIGRAWRGGRWWYYLDDGVYGAYSGQLYEQVRYPLQTVPATGALRPSVLAGPTCDSIDIIAEDIELPELALGDLVIGRMMGAYTLATASEFNSLPRPRVVALNAPAQPARVAFIG
ncbi:MAG: type III PLP-dependent enzyme [Candidatus Competibacterales bacterium]|nr:type III PLP-dependent enzyme [Candidatus Competibacterales bacterium]